MKTVHQLSLFVENKPGALKEPCRVLGEAGINILSLSLADTNQFGILRLVVKDWRRAREALEAAGSVVNVAELVAVDIPDRPGGLAAALEAIEGASLDIEYMYPFKDRVSQRAVLMFRFSDPQAAVAALHSCGLHIVGDEELYAGL